MNRSSINRLKKLELKEGNRLRSRKKTALILCDSELPEDFNDFKVDAKVVLILPDNGHRGPEKTVPKGGYSVYYQ